MNENLNQEENAELQMMALEAELQTITDECNQLQSQLQSTGQVTISDLNMQNNASQMINQQNNTQSLLLENEDMQQQLSYLQLELEETQIKLQKKDQEHTKTVSEIQAQLEQQLTQLMEKELEISTLKEQIKAQAETIANQETQLNDKDGQITQLTQQVDILQQQAQQQQNLADIQSQLDEFQQQYQQLSKYYNEQKQLLQDKDKQIQELQRNNINETVVQQLENELKETKLLVLSNKDVILEYQQRILQLSQQNNLHIQKINSMTAIQASLIDTVNQLREQCAEYEAEIAKMDQTNNKTKPVTLADSNNDFLDDSHLKKVAGSGSGDKLNKSDFLPPLDQSGSPQECAQEEELSLKELSDVRSTIKGKQINLGPVKVIIKDLQQQLNQIPKFDVSQTILSLTQKIQQYKNIQVRNSQNPSTTEFEQQISKLQSEIQNKDIKIKDLENSIQTLIEQQDQQAASTQAQAISQLEQQLVEARQSLVMSQDQIVALKVQLQELETLKTELAYKSEELVKQTQNSDKITQQLTKLVALQQTQQKSFQDLKAKEKQNKIKYSQLEKKSNIQLQTITTQYKEIQQLNNMLLTKDAEIKLLHTDIQNLQNDLQLLKNMNVHGSDDDNEENNNYHMSGVNNDESINILAQQYNKKLEMMLE